MADRAQAATLTKLGSASVMNRGRPSSERSKEGLAPFWGWKVSHTSLPPAASPTGAPSRAVVPGTGTLDQVVDPAREWARR
jgi:hypothetical protein